MYEYVFDKEKIGHCHWVHPGHDEAMRRQLRRTVQCSLFWSLKDMKTRAHLSVEDGRLIWSGKPQNGKNIRGREGNTDENDVIDSLLISVIARLEWRSNYWEVRTIKWLTAIFRHESHVWTDERSINALNSLTYVPFQCAWKVMIKRSSELMSAAEHVNDWAVRGNVEADKWRTQRVDFSQFLPIERVQFLAIERVQFLAIERVQFLPIERVLLARFLRASSFVTLVTNCVKGKRKLLFCCFRLLCIRRAIARRKYCTSFINQTAK